MLRSSRVLPCLFACVVGLAPVACSGAADESDSTGEAITADQMQQAQAAVDTAEQLSNAEPSAMRRIQDVRTIPSADPTIGSWAAYTLTAANTDSEDLLSEHQPTEMAFAARSSESMIVIYVNTAGGDAVVAPESFDRAALRHTLARDIERNQNAPAQVSPNSVRMQTAVNEGLELLVQLAAKQLKTLPKEIMAKLARRQVVSTDIVKIPAGAVDLEAQVASKAAKTEASKVGGRARATPAAKAGALSESELAVLRGERLTVHVGKEGEAAFAKKMTGKRALFVGDRLDGYSRVGSQNYIDGYPLSANEFGSWLTLYPLQNKTLGRLKDINGGMVTEGNDGIVMAVDAARAMAKRGVADSTMKAFPGGEGATLYVTGQTLGAAYTSALKLVTDVYCTYPLPEVYPRLIEALLAGKTVHVIEQQARDSIVGAIQAMYKAPGSGLAKKIPMEELVKRVVHDSGYR